MISWCVWLASLGLLACPSQLMISPVGLQLMVMVHGCYTLPHHSHFLLSVTNGSSHPKAMLNKHCTTSSKLHFLTLLSPHPDALCLTFHTDTCALDSVFLLHGTQSPLQLDTICILKFQHNGDCLVCSRILSLWHRAGIEMVLTNVYWKNEQGRLFTEVIFNTEVERIWIGELRHSSGCALLLPSQSWDVGM